MELSKKNEFMTRLISTMVLIPIILCSVKLGGIYFKTMIMVCSILMSYEWAQMTASEKTINWKIIGLFYISLPCLSLIFLIDQKNGISTIFSIFIIVWATDIGGYIFGKLIGGWKLAPEISPNKTWAGFFGGIFLAVLAGLYCKEMFYFVIIVSIIAQLGDLLESYIKRKHALKDSGNIIPGHGGVLDAVDGIVLVAPLIALSKYITG